MALRVLASGVDTLHLSARGVVRAELWEALDSPKGRAQAEEVAAPFGFAVTGRLFLVKPYGLRGYTYWLMSPDFELLVGRSERFPAALVQLHSAGLYSMGAERAVEAVQELLRVEVFANPSELIVSRIDVYADSTGWALELADLERFVCRGRSRRGFVQRELTFASGRRLTGFMFGRDALVARLYDKTAEIALRGVTWLHDLWGERDGEAPVWRLEFQYRRKVLVKFGLRAVDEVLVGVQDLWRYGTHEWLSVRTATEDPRPHLAGGPDLAGGGGGPGGARVLRRRPAADRGGGRGADRVGPSGLRDFLGSAPGVLRAPPDHRGCGADPRPLPGPAQADVRGRGQAEAGAAAVGHGTGRRGGGRMNLADASRPGPARGAPSGACRVPGSHRLRLPSWRRGGI